MNQIGQLASDIYDNELDNATTELGREREVEKISGWLLANEGLLNTLIYTNFSGVNPGFKQEEADIYKQIYLSHYYKKSSRDTLRVITSESVDWIRLSEGDTTIVRNNKNEIAKTYLSLAKDAEEQIKQLVYSYTLYGARPLQVAGLDGGWPTGSGYYAPGYYYYGYYPYYGRGGYYSI